MSYIGKQPTKAPLTASDIEDGAVVAAEIASNAVTTAKINADAVTGAKIADDAINSEHYTDGSVDTAHIADANVTTAKIADDAVTAAKINNDIISGSTELAAEPADTDEFLVSDAGTLKRIDYSHIKGGGKILQVVSGNHTSQASTTSNSYQDVSSNLNVSITPSATSSKILIMAHFNECFHNSTTNGMGHFLQVTAAGSEIHRMHTVYFADIGGEEMVSQDLISIHSPSTTSAVEYKMRFKSQVSGQTVVINQNSAPGGSSLILMEIGA